MPQVSIQRDANNASIVTLFGVRIAYAQHLNVAQAGKPDPKTGLASAPKYSCVLLIPETEQAVLATITQVMQEQATAVWGADAAGVWTEMQYGNKLALKPGASKATTEGFAGTMFLSPGAKESNPPLLLHKYLKPDGSGVQELKRPQNVIYSGCYVNAQVAFWVQNNAHGRRINCEILAVQFADDGDSFGGGASANTSVFGGVAAPAAGGFGAAPAAGGFGQAPAAGGFGAAPVQQPAGFGAAPAAGGFGQPPVQQPAGFGAPAGFGQAPVQQPAGFGQAPVQQPVGFGAPAI